MLETKTPQKKGLHKAMMMALLTISTLVSMTGCGEKSALVGTWECDGLTVELLKDGSGISGGKSFTWKAENHRFYTIYPDSRSYALNYTVSGQTLTLTQDNGEVKEYRKVKNNAKPKETSKPELNSLVGIWEFNGVNMELLKDGSGISGEQSFTWKAENHRFYIIHPDSRSYAFNYTVTGQTLTLTHDNGKVLMIYRKVKNNAKPKEASKPASNSW